MNTIGMSDSGGNAKESAEQYVHRVCAANPNLLVAHYLIHSYLYYERDTNIITDHTFTWICKEMVRQWTSIEHPHKWRVRIEIVTEAPSGFYLKDYPTITKSSAILLAQQYGALLE